MMPWSKRRVILVIIPALALLATGLWFQSGRDDPQQWTIYNERELFNGHRAVIRVDQRKAARMFLLPGQSGDRPGKISIYATSGEHCGDADVDMVGNFTLDWDEADDLIYLARPREARWDMTTCQVRFTDLYPELE